MDYKKPKMDKDVEIIEGKYDEIKDWVKDPKGYFLIRINKGLIEVGFCKKDNVIEKVFTGKNPQEIYCCIIEKGLVSRLDHAAYLGKELEKAYLALKNNLKYVQDEELVL